jgi:tRNA nucleotidyltransferase/poly(A) polymerase
MAAKLYELTGMYAELVAMLDDCETEEQAAEIIAQINDVSSDISEKAENYAYIRMNLKAEADELAARAAIFKAEADRLNAKSKSKENHIKRMNDHLLFAMELAGLKQMPTSIGKFYTQETTSVEVLDAWKVPEQFTTPQPPKVDKNAIKKAFRETGEIFDGVEINVASGVRFR